jgi:hypothetical protein
LLLTFALIEKGGWKMKFLHQDFKKILILIIVSGPFLMGRVKTISAGETVSTEIRWLQVGSLHSFYANIGAEVEFFRTGSFYEQTDGLRWPAQYPYQDHCVAKSMWIGVTNVYDYGMIVPVKVVCVGPRQFDMINEIIPAQFKMIGRFNAPTVLVDGETATDNAMNDLVDEIDPDLKSDRMIVNKLHSSTGITVTRKIMAFSQQNNDNYFIYDYVFKNTGWYHKEYLDPIPGILTDCIFHFQYRYAFGWESTQMVWWAPSNNIRWGRNCLNDVVGQEPNDPDFEFRAHFSWYGPHSLSQVDDYGCPDWKSGGVMAAVQYAGVVTLHADKSANDKTDDLYQPSTTLYLGSNQYYQSNNQMDTLLAKQKYEIMTAGHSEKTHAEEVGDDFADLWGNDPGGYAQGQGFGPYTLALGDSIHIIMAEGISGLSRLKNIEVCKNWYENNAPFILPDGAVTDDRDEYKKQWVQTGKDSLFQTFRRAVINFNSDYGIPRSPLPPDTFQVRSGSDKIWLSWSDNAEDWPNFDGYQIFRAVGQPDTIYEKIFECDKSNTVYSFEDPAVIQGLDYYYYIQTKDDGSTNDIYPGVPLVSSKFWTITNQPAYLKSTVISENENQIPESFSLFQNYPNPFNPTTTFKYDMPKESKVHLVLYDINGRLIETLVNEKQQPGYYSIQWDATQYSSGVYIYRIQEDGFSAVKKCLLIK